MLTVTIENPAEETRNEALKIVTPYTRILERNRAVINRFASRSVKFEEHVPNTSIIEQRCLIEELTSPVLGDLANDWIRAHEGKTIKEFNSVESLNDYKLLEDLKAFQGFEEDLQSVFKPLIEIQRPMLQSASLDDRRRLTIKGGLDTRANIDENKIRKYILPNFELIYGGQVWLATDLTCANYRDQFRAAVRPMVWQGFSREKIRESLEALGTCVADGTIKLLMYQVKLEKRALDINMSGDEFMFEAKKVGMTLYGAQSAQTILENLATIYRAYSPYFRSTTQSY
jgi:hypothetical protein